MPDLMKRSPMSELPMDPTQSAPDLGGGDLKALLARLGMAGMDSLGVGGAMGGMIPKLLQQVLASRAGVGGGAGPAKRTPNPNAGMAV